MTITTSFVTLLAGLSIFIVSLIQIVRRLEKLSSSKV